MLRSLATCLAVIVCVGCSPAEDDKGRRDAALHLVDTVRTTPGTACADPKLESERASARTIELRVANVLEKVAKSEPLSLKDLDGALNALTLASVRFMDVQTECLIVSGQPL